MRRKVIDFLVAGKFCGILVCMVDSPIKFWVGSLNLSVSDLICRTGRNGPARLRHAYQAYGSVELCLGQKTLGSSITYFPNLTQHMMR